MTVLLILVLVLAAAVGFRYWSRRRIHDSLLAATLSDHQRAIVAEQVPLTRRLPTELQRKLEGRIKAFLNQVEFIGCNGLEVTEEMRLSIAAQACLLIVNSDTWYDHVSTILIYPGAFKSRQIRRSGYIVTEHDSIRTGESWSRGPVVLSWPHTRQGALNDRDGHNVVLHEFAHQLDDLSGRTNGIPILNKGQSLDDWGHVFVKAYESHVQHVHSGHKTVFDAYGAEGMEEFFAVAVETFFEKPAMLKKREPEVYQQLSLLFQLEPSTWK